MASAAAAAELADSESPVDSDVSRGVEDEANVDSESWVDADDDEDSDLEIVASSMDEAKVVTDEEAIADAEAADTAGAEAEDAANAEADVCRYSLRC